MPLRTAMALWEGDLIHGKGKMSLGSGTFEGSYSFRTRFEDEPGTNPEELIGAAHAGCFSMELANELSQTGFTPDSINTTAKVNLIKKPDGFEIELIELVTEGIVPGIDEEKFIDIAESAKTNCPVSQALKGVQINLLAVLLSE